MKTVKTTKLKSTITKPKVVKKRIPFKDIETIIPTRFGNITKLTTRSRDYRNLRKQEYYYACDIYAACQNLFKELRTSTLSSEDIVYYNVDGLGRNSIPKSTFKDIYGSINVTEKVKANTIVISVDEQFSFENELLEVASKTKYEQSAGLEYCEEEESNPNFDCDKFYDKDLPAHMSKYKEEKSKRFLFKSGPDQYGGYNVPFIELLTSDKKLVDIKNLRTTKDDNIFSDEAFTRVLSMAKSEDIEMQKLSELVLSSFSFSEENRARIAFCCFTINDNGGKHATLVKYLNMLSERLFEGDKLHNNDALVNLMLYRDDPLLREVCSKEIKDNIGIIDERIKICVV